MQTHSIDIPANLQKFFSVVPENAVLFGGAIRDLIRSKNKVNDLDLLFKNHDDINNFFENIIRKIDSNATISSIKYFEQVDDDFISDNEINVNVKRIYFYIDGQIDSELRCIDCIVAKNPTNGFLSDYDVNALYGVVKNNKVEVVGDIIKYNTSIIKNINRIKESKVAIGYFKESTSQRIIDWRKSKIEKNGFVASFNSPEENDSRFASANEILHQAAEYFKSQMSKEEQEILAKNNSHASYEYCLKNKDANISLHEEIIIKSNNVGCIYYFARDIKGANIDKLEDAIIKTNNSSYIYAFAIDVKGANITNLEDGIIKTNNTFYIYLFAKNIKNANIEKLEDAIIKANDIDYIYLFAKYVKRANLEKFKNILENSKYKKEFANFYENYKYNSSSNLSESKESPKAVKETKEEKKMTNTGFDIEFFTKNFAEGAYAGAANEVVNNLAKSLILAIKASGMDEGSVKIIEDGMNSQLGKICLAMMVGTGIKFIPVNLLQENKSLQKIAEKCVENAGSQGTQFALNGAMNILLPALLGAIQDNPQLKLAEQVGALTAPTKARVESNPKDLADDLSEEEANAFNEEFAKKKAKSGLNK